MTTNSTFPDSLCLFRNPLGYCTLSGGCIATSKTVEVPIQKEEVPLAETITPDIIRKELMVLIDSLCIWDCPDENGGSEWKTRSLFYIQGAYEMADVMIKKLEESK